MPKILRVCCCSVLFFLFFTQLHSQDTRTQYPKLMRNAYFNLSLGYIDYHFTNEQLEPGFQVESVETPHLAMRLVFFGYRFNKNLSAQVSYMKPPIYVQYKNVNGDKGSHSVWMHYGTLTVKGNLPVSKIFSPYAEAGLGIVTRKGFAINNTHVVKDASYGTYSLSGGFDFHVNPKWDITTGVTYAPGNSAVKQPHTLFYLAGFRYNVQPLSEEKVKANANTGHIFPRTLLQLGYSTNAFGYGVNNAVSKGPVAIFWGGKVNIKEGLWLKYQRNIFHTKKVFSLDVGTSAGWWRSNNEKESIYTLSVYPMMRFTVMRIKPMDLYFNYSAIGPSFISRVNIDSKETGTHFTFQDFMGMGVFVGNKRNVNAEISINHYSNGNVFPQNAGLKIPLTFNLGYCF
jgi:hypothetical protein